MPYRHRLSRTAGLSFRLGLGLVLLLASTGLALATTLLLSLATHAGPAAPGTWAATSLAAPSAKLSLLNPHNTDFQLVGLHAPASWPRRPFADTCRHRGGRAGARPRPVLHHRAVRRAAPGHSSTATAAGTASVVHRSWSTVKTMFR